MNKKGIVTTFILALLTLPIYIYSYKNGVWELFWTLFVVDRIISPILEPKLDKGLNNIEVVEGNSKETIAITRLVIFMIFFCIVGVVGMSYILFRYPKLFIILIIGEIMDNVLKKIIAEYKK